MAIDTSKEVQAEFFAKWMTVERMEEAIAHLPLEAELHPNAVGNLTVLHEGAYIGYIDFQDEGYYSLDDDEEVEGE